jgi:hypothetical protein
MALAKWRNLLDIRIKKTGIIASVISTVTIIGLSGMALAAEFSADSKQTVGEKMTITGKTYVKGNLERKETYGKAAQVMIVRPDKGIMWILKPTEKKYTEMKIRGPKGNMLDKLKQIPNFKKAGTARISGYMCDKYTFNDTKNNITGTAYISSQLGHELKVDANMMGMKTILELKNIKEGPQPISLFSVPKGYKKQEMVPMKMPGMGGKGMPKFPGMGGKMPH